MEENGLPKYLSIKYKILNMIKSGELREGDQIPTETALSGQCNCSRLTVRKALDELVNENAIYKVQGVGTFVKKQNALNSNRSRVDSCSGLISSQGKVPSKKIIYTGMAECDEDLAEMFKKNVGDRVFKYERVYYADGVPVIYSTSYYNIEELPGIEKYDLTDKSIISVIKNDYGITLHRANRLMKAVLADKTVAKLLDVAPGLPLLSVMDFKTGISKGKEIPIEYYKFLYVTEKIDYSPSAS